MRYLGLAAIVAGLVSSGGPGEARLRAAAMASPAQAELDQTRIVTLLKTIEGVALRADVPGYLALLSASAERSTAAEFAASEFRTGAGRVVIQERDRQDLAGTLPGNGYTLTVDAFMEYGNRGRAATWVLDIKRVDDEWRVAGQERVSAVENLYRLSLNSQQQFDARQFTVLSEDFELALDEGSVFTVETDQGVTGLVLLGRGAMRFHPDPPSEKGQVRIFSGSDVLETRFEAAYVRAGTYELHADGSGLTPRPVDPRELRRADQVFREELVKSFVVDLADLTRDTWSILPAAGDFLAEVRTRRYGTLTYARSASEPEDISFFKRRRQRNIAVYTSKGKLAARGPFYNEDELTPFDVLDYDIGVTALPERQWIEGRTVMRLRVRTPGLTQLTIRLADSLVVRSVTSPRLGRLFSLRVMHQNSVLVNLPSPQAAGTELTVAFEYAGRLEAQAPDRETQLGGQREPSTSEMEGVFIQAPEPSYLYSNRSYWYPQGMVSDYATATIAITVPSSFTCVASGELSSDSPRPALVPSREPSAARSVYVFTAERPLRYLSFLVTRLTRADRWTVVFDGPRLALETARGASRGEPYRKLDLVVDANPRQAGRGKDVAEQAVDIVQYYESLIGDSPYSALTLALVESSRPGGHSPGYFAVLNQPLAYSGVTWRNDPASFPNYPEFFLAHEIAHQWWGQAVAGRNYHEQWLSEGFAQYFAALYAQKARGDAVFEGMIRQMRRWAIDASDQGAIYLGYRVGHIGEDSRVFRAVVYNKAAVVLHMLRRLVGDAAFFAGIRTFYADSRFTKTSTEDLRAAMERSSGRPLERFFERWVYGTTLPRLSFSYRVEGSELVARFEQSGDVFDVPVTVSLRYQDGRPGSVVIPVVDRVVDARIPLSGLLRSAEISRDDGTLLK
jgi:hypothetical protein